MTITGGLLPSQLLTAGSTLVCTKVLQQVCVCVGGGGGGGGGGIPGTVPGWCSNYVMVISVNAVLSKM